MTDGNFDDPVERELRSYLERMASYPRVSRSPRATTAPRVHIRSGQVLASVVVAAALVFAGLALRHQLSTPGGGGHGSGTTAPTPPLTGLPVQGLPAHGQIAFQLASGPVGAACNIVTIEPDGTGLRMLTHVGSGGGCDGDPAWTPKGDRIVFDIGGDAFSHLFSMDGSGGSIRQLTTGPGVDADPVVSPDGVRIAFDRGGGPKPPLSGIFLMNADGSHIVRLTTPPASSANGDSQPDFSPDGTKLAFVRNGAIYVIGLDGTGLRQVTPAFLDAARPRWSPNGSQLLFGSSATAITEVGQNVNVVNADGSGLVALTHEVPVNSAEEPAWSPDGAMIVFDQFHGGDNFVGLVVMHADGSDQKLIWHPEPSTYNVPHKPTWGTAP